MAYNDDENNQDKSKEDGSEVTQDDAGTVVSDESNNSSSSQESSSVEESSENKDSAISKDDSDKSTSKDVNDESTVTEESSEKTTKQEADIKDTDEATPNASQSAELKALASTMLPEEDDEFEFDISDTDGIDQKISRLIATGHMFQAHGIAKKAFQKNPGNPDIAQAYALVLLKTGAVEEARKLIYSILEVTPARDEATGELMLTLESVHSSRFMKDGKPESLTMIGLIFKEAWKYSRHCRDLEISRDLYLNSFNQDNKTLTGMNAAWLSWLTGEDDQAKKLAAAVLKLLPPFGLEASFAELIDLAEAQLLLGREDDCCKLYEEAMKQEDQVLYIDIVNARQQLYFLREAGLKVPNRAFEILTPPTIVVFTGHAIDHPSYQVPLFPQELEADVKGIITDKLKSINAKIGYSSASCGADIIFIEALQSIGGEVNIILPFAITDFIETNVRHAGPRWEKRFEKALQSAHSVTFASEDRYLGHDMLYRFANHVMHGSAVMRGRFLTTDPHLMAVWHSRTNSAPGGPTDFIDRWTNISTLHLIDLDELGVEGGNAVEQIDNELITAYTGTLGFDPFISKSPDRMIKSMMFSDLSGYSKLQDEHIPSFLDFLNKLNDAMNKIDIKLESLNTWGDAIFAVADSAIKIAEFGLRYCDIIENLGSKYPEFPFPIRARISLHSGPVFIAEDPFIKKMNFYGGHINRAARLEPVTTVGQVYATQQFVALLNGETSDECNEYTQKGLKYFDRYQMEYVGMISLAKSFGQQEVYHLRRR